MVEARLQPLHDSVDLGKHVAAVDRLERALPLQPQIGRNEDERRKRRERHQTRQHRPRQVAGRGEGPQLAERIEHRIKG